VVLGALLSAGVAASGLRRLRTDRLVAFRRFERAVWLSLLLTRVFQFGISQSSTLVAIAADLVVLACVGAELHELRRAGLRPGGGLSEDPGGGGPAGPANLVVPP
jgi:hypothetical protein